MTMVTLSDWPDLEPDSALLDHLVQAVQAGLLWHDQPMRPIFTDPARLDRFIKVEKPVDKFFIPFDPITAQAMQQQSQAPLQSIVGGSYSNPLVVQGTAQVVQAVAQSDGQESGPLKGEFGGVCGHPTCTCHPATFVEANTDRKRHYCEGCAAEQNNRWGQPDKPYCIPGTKPKPGESKPACDPKDEHWYHLDACC